MREAFERSEDCVERWYERLLLALPAPFRREHRTELVEAFRDQSFHEFEVGGYSGVRRYWIRAFCMLLACGLRERLARIGHHVAHLLRTLSRVGTHVEKLTQDILFALRTHRKRPLFAAVAVLTLGLGIGASTTVYAITDTVLLKKPPFPELHRLVTVWTTRPNWRGRETLDRRWDRVHMSPEEYRNWSEGTSTFEKVALFKSIERMVTYSDEGESERMSVGVASASLLSVLGIQTVLGRWFLASEDSRGAEHVVVLGYSLWKTRFDSDPNVLGSTVRLRDNDDEAAETFTVIGVAPPELRLRMTIDWDSPRGFSLWRSADVGEKDLWFPVGVAGDSGVQNYEGIGRLRRGVSLQQAAAETAPLIRGDAPLEERGVRVMPRSGVVTAGLRSQMLLLAAPSVLLLLIAFSNIAALLLGETESRAREVATRMALGASRGRIRRQLLTESAMLGLMGSVLGILAAVLSTNSLVAIAPPASPLREVDVFWPALIFACAAGILGALLFGIAPAFGAEVRSGGLHLRTGTRGSDHGSSGLQSKIVSLQVAFTAIMLVLGGLLGRTLVNLSRVDLGFDRENLAVVRFHMPQPDTKAVLVPQLDAVLEAVQALPGIESVGMIQSLPMTGWGGTWDDEIHPEGLSLESLHRIQLRIVSPGYHETLRIPLLAGRHLSQSDVDPQSKVAVVSETLARAVWPDCSPIGESFRQMGRRYTVVGVVADVRHHGIVEDYVSIAYTPYAQRPVHFAAVVARTDMGISVVLPSIRSAIQSASSNITLRTSTSMSELVSSHATDQHIHAYLAAGFSIVAVLLAAAGVFAVAARTVARRSRELAIKKALGAAEHMLVGRVVRSGLGQALVGVLMGLAMAFAGGRFIVSFLFGVSPADPLTYVAVALLVVVVSSLASYVPARRITTVDPVEVLRAE